MRAARKPKAKKGGLLVALPPPRPLYGMAADLYALLVVDLEETIGSRLKLEKRVSMGTRALATALDREKRLRNQLATFAPALEGFEHDAPPPADPPPMPPAPPPQEPASAAASV